MLCQKCGRQEATVHLESTVFRQKIEEHLCALCAGMRHSDKVGNLTPQAPPGGEQHQAMAAFDVKGKNLRLKLPISVRDLAAALEVKPFRLIAAFMEMGVFVTLKQSLAEDIVAKLAKKYGFSIEIL